MYKAKGLGVSNGYKKGVALILKDGEVQVEHVHITDTALEIKKTDNAFKLTCKQISDLKDAAAESIGDRNAGIFDAHLEILDDPLLRDKIEYYINEEKRESSWAVATARDEIKKLFDEIDDEYMRARAADISDICNRIIRNIKGIKDIDFNKIKEDTILITHDLTPSDTAKIGNSPIVGFATEVGGVTSHSAIMAAAMNIPAVVGLGDNFLENVSDNDIVLIDGKDGEIIINPDEETLRVFTKKIEESNEEEKRLKLFINKNGATKDGKKIIIEGNIGIPRDVENVISFGGEGIGLFRSEFLFINRQTLPSEEEQFESYSEVVKAMKGKPVIIRTLDIGGDKNVPAMNLPKETNPFLGYRAIRICLKRTTFFKIQAKAILRASAFGKIKVMFPMISSLGEVLSAKKIFEKAKEELTEEGKKFDESIEIGVMIEIPAAAIISDILAQNVDFFSIGTNDLIQYTCAVDRVNEKVSYIYQPLHPAILKLIKMVSDSAQKYGIECGVCGEMAGSAGLSPLLVGLGVTNLSMSSSKILRTKEFLSNFTFDQCKKIADDMLKNTTTEENLDYFEKNLRIGGK